MTSLLLNLQFLFEALLCCCWGQVFPKGNTKCLKQNVRRRRKLVCERETIQDQGKSLAPRHQGGRKGGPNCVEHLKQVLFELTHNQGVCWLLFKVSWDVCFSLSSDVSSKSHIRVWDRDEGVTGRNGREHCFPGEVHWLTLQANQWFFTYLASLIFDCFALPDLSDCICLGSTGLFSYQNFKKFRLLKPYFVLFFRACILKVLMG